VSEQYNINKEAQKSNQIIKITMQDNQQTLIVYSMLIRMPDK